MPVCTNQLKANHLLTCLFLKAHIYYSVIIETVMLLYFNPLTARDVLYGCVLRTDFADTLVLKHPIINNHSADFASIV